MIRSRWRQISRKHLNFRFAAQPLPSFRFVSAFNYVPQLTHSLVTQESFKFKVPYQQYRFYSTLTPVEFEEICGETLESLTERFEQLGDLDSAPPDFDVNYAAGVLTIELGSVHGTYVINKQTPNAQIWLSSPISGPKRYDFNGKTWYYKHDNSVLHELLEKELSEIFGSESNFSRCSYGGK